MSPQCPKCGREMNGPFWHEKRPFPQSAACGHNDVARKNGEHLHYYCVCGFDCTTPTVKKIGASHGADGTPGDGLPALVYEIANVGDFLKVPPKRLRACLREFKIALEMARATATLLNVSADALHPGATVGATFKRFRWIDDAKRTATLKIEIGESVSPHPNPDRP